MGLFVSNYQVEFYQIIYMISITISALPLFAPLVMDLERRGIETPFVLKLFAGLGFLIAFTFTGFYLQFILILLLFSFAPLGAGILALAFFIFCVYLFIRATFDPYFKSINRTRV